PVLQAVAEPALRRDHEILGIRVERVRDDLLAPAGAVDVGGVDQRHAELERPPQHARTLRGIVNDAHRAEADAADLELAAEEEGRVHRADATRRAAVASRACNRSTACASWTSRACSQAPTARCSSPTSAPTS